MCCCVLVYVCSLQEVAGSMFPDRVISVRGPIDNMSEAEAAISAILRECYEKEMQQPPVVGDRYRPLGLSLSLLCTD